MVAKQSPVSLRVRCTNCANAQTVVWPVEIVPLCSRCGLRVSGYPTQMYNEQLAERAFDVVEQALKDYPR